MRYVTPVTSVPSRTFDVSRDSAAEHRPGLEHGSVVRTDAPDLIEVVHHGDQAEAGRLGGLGLFHRPLEQRSGGASGKV